MRYVKSRSYFLLNESRTQELSDSKFEKLYNENCKVHRNLSQFEEVGYGTTYKLYRGSFSPYKTSFIDPKQHERWSIEPENIHVSFMSQDPLWRDFPKYNQSLIGSTSRGDASGYGNIFEVIPYDGADIAFCPKDSIWSSFGGFRDNVGVYKVSNFLRCLEIGIDLQKDWNWIKKELQQIERFYRDPEKQIETNPWTIDLDGEDPNYLNLLNEIQNGKDFVTYDEVIEEIERTFSPEEFISLKYDMNYHNDFDSFHISGTRQFWTDSKCLLRKIN